MLQRPSIKLPTSRLSQSGKPKSNVNLITNENHSHSLLSNSQLFVSSESPHQETAFTPIMENDDDDNDCTDSHNSKVDSTAFVASSMKNTENIQCMIRIRPVSQETESRGRICVDLNTTNNMITIDCKPKMKSFTFDHVGGVRSTQESIFQVVGKPITNACLSGYNGTIFAYGQTGSGKTFTILGDYENKNSSQRGLMPRVFDYLFSQIQRHRQKMGLDRVEYLVKCSCLEIYNERIQDLLEPDRCNLQIREDIKRGVVVEGLSYKVCETANHALDLIQIASRNRRVSETAMNKESSRSHLMFSLLMECRITDHKQKQSGIDQVTQTPAFTRTRSRVNNKNLVRTRTSRFNLVDLAGSERQSKTNATGDRLREAGNINKSLTVLGHVMKALVQRNVDKDNKHRHIHYRDSKLTHLLKDSLGGNSLTFMIACISPSSLNLLESLSTLQFASRAKYIKNKAQLNEDQSGSIQVLKAENLKLINQVQKLKNMMRTQKDSLNTSRHQQMDVDDDPQKEQQKEEESRDSVDTEKLRDSLEILERENYTIRREREGCKTEMAELNNVIEKKQQFVMNLKMQLKLRERETVKLREDKGMINGFEEKERKCLLCDPSLLIEEHIKNLELQQQSQQMMDFIHRFVDEKDNKFRNDQYMKWKNLYQVLVDENEELREEMRLNKTDSLKMLAVKEEMVNINKSSEYESKINTLNNDMETMEEGYKKKIDGLQQEINVLQESEQQLKNKHNDLENGFGELSSKIQLEERKYLMEKEAMKEEYTKQLENMRQGAVRALDSNNEESMKLKMEITQLNAKMDATEKALLESQAQHREQTKTLQCVTTDLEDKTKACDEWKTKCESQNEEISRLNDKIKDKDNEMSRLKVDITRIEDDIKEKDVVISETESAQKELEDEIGEKHSNITRLEAELETTIQQFSDLKLQYSSLMDDHQILNDVHSTLEYQKGEMDDKMERMKEDIEVLKMRNSDLSQQIEDKKNIIDNLQDSVSEKMQNTDETVKNLNKKNQDLLVSAEEINKEMDSIKKSLKESQNEILRKDNDISALKRHLNTNNGQLTDYKSAHQELETKYSNYVTKCKELQHSLNETQMKCDTYNTQLIDKNIKLQRLLEDVDALQNESALTVKSFNEEIASLQTQIENKNGEIESIKESMNKEIEGLNNTLKENEMKWTERLKESKGEHEEKLNTLNDKINNIDKDKTSIEKDYVLIESKYENSKCKLKEKEETLSLLEQQLSQFKCNINNNKDEYNAVFDELNNKISLLKKENEELESKLETAKQLFESHKENMVEQLARAHQDVELRQNRSERLITTFEQRLELRQKQNVEYREKIDELSVTITNRNTVINKQNTEITSVKDQLKRCQNTVSNAQSLNETLLTEKAEFDNKLEGRDREIEEITMKHNKLQQDLALSMEQRITAIKTSKRMRTAEEKAFNEMLEWKTKYNDLEETSQRIQNEMNDLKSSNEKLCIENSKLAGHHNAQQRINHLLNLKKECEKLKKEKKQYLNKISSLQKKLGQNIPLNSSICSTESDTNTKQPLIKDEIGENVTKILNTIRNIAQLSVVEDNIDQTVNANNVEQHLVVLNTISNVIHDQNNQIIKLKRDIHGLINDINIRDEQIKLLQDQIVLQPTLQQQEKQKTKKKRRHTISPSKRKKTNNIKRHSTDNFNFD